MKIVLLKPHEHQGKKYDIGEEIDVTKEQYDFLMNSYICDRKILVKQIKNIEDLKTTKGVK